jgi:hypothetical protein
MLLVSLFLSFSSLSFASGGMEQVAPCRVNPKVQEQRSQELQRIFQGDQEDRAEIEAHPEIPLTQAKVIAIGRRDLKRRKRVSEIFAEGCMNSAQDFSAAAMVFQHGTSPDHFFQAYVWSKKAVDLGDQSQRYVVALGIDRYLVNIGHKQLFGSQAIKEDPAGPCWCLLAIEPDFPDSVRTDYTVRTKAAAVDWVKNTLNRGVSCLDIECKKELLPSPRGTVPGLW